jgi:putative acetyltransferase
MMDKVLIRSETSADVSAIAEVTVAAFKTLAISNHTEQFIIAALRAAKALTVSLVAEVDGRVVGHIAFSPLTISDGSPNWYGLGLPVQWDRPRVDTGRDMAPEGSWCPGVLPRGPSGVLQALWVPKHRGAYS